MPDLTRFLTAQATIYSTALAELQAGAKRTHWMWFVFPQIAGLGSSGMARRYALSGLDEAQDYLAHPVLGARLLECTAAVLPHAPRGAHAVFGTPDDRKFRSSSPARSAAFLPASRTRRRSCGSDRRSALW